MLTLKSLKTEVDAVRPLADAAHSEAVAARRLAGTHAHVFVVHGGPLPGQQVVADGPITSLSETREDLDDLSCGVYDIRADVTVIKSDVETLKSDVGTLKVDVAVLRADMGTVKSDITEIKSDVATLKSDFKLMNQRQDRMDQRQDRMDQRQDRMDQNIAAIMRHLGIDPIAA